MSESNTNGTHQQAWEMDRGAMRFMLGLGLGPLAALSPSPLADDDRALLVPSEIAVPATNKVHLHAYAVGFQSYTWDGASWGTAVPEATLYDDDGKIIAKHFAGPTWQSRSGSKVVGALPPLRITVDRTAIEWLRIKAASAGGFGIFAGTTFIQRVNTTGGLPPRKPGIATGQVVHVPYTADYFFYRHSTE